MDSIAHQLRPNNGHSAKAHQKFSPLPGTTLAASASAHAGVLVINERLLAWSHRCTYMAACLLRDSASPLSQPFTHLLSVCKVVASEAVCESIFCWNTSG